jgi:RNA polymerase sigma-70 factor (ECF subfamily)
LTLLQRARSNDADAWTRLFQLYQPLVLYWCTRMGIHAPEAEDVGQEVFREAATSIQSFHHDQLGDTFRGWLRGITRNVVLTHFRRRRRHIEAAGGSDALIRLQQIPEALTDDGEDPAEQLSALYRRALDLIRGEFEERTWHMFCRTVFDSQAPVQVAHEMGVSAAAVRQAKARVLRRLKQEVGELAP